MWGPFSLLIAFLRSMYRNAVCKKALCMANTGSDEDVGMMVYGTSRSAIDLSHWREFSWTMDSEVDFMLRMWQMLAPKCALKVWTTNSSPTLKTLTSLSTWSRLMVSLILDKEPCWIGVPQKVRNMTFKHSHRKWKSPVWVTTLNLYLFEWTAYSPGVSRAHVSLSLECLFVALHSLQPRIFLHVSWSPTTICCVGYALWVILGLTLFCFVVFFCVCMCSSAVAGVLFLEFSPSSNIQMAQQLATDKPYLLQERYALTIEGMG